MANRWPKGVMVLPKGRMTLEKLARMVQVGFIGIQDSTRSSFAEVYHRFEKLEQQLAMLRRFSENRFDYVDTELTSLRRKLSEVVNAQEFQVLERRLEALERKAGIRAK